MTAIEITSRLRPYTDRENTILALRGWAGMLTTTREDMLVKELDKKGVEREVAIELMRDFVAQGLVVKHDPAELSGDVVHWAITEAGAAVKDAIRKGQLLVALELLGEIEPRHEQVLKAADRGQHTSEIAGAWRTLNLDWGLIETVRELVELEMVQPWALTMMSQHGVDRGGNLQLQGLGMDLIRHQGWSRHTKSA